MTDEYFPLDGCTPLTDPSELSLHRSRELTSAIAKNPDYALVGLFKRSHGFQEIIVVEVETHDVPPKSPSGIRFRERIALCVPSDSKTLIDVRTLRKTFPVLPHENNVGLRQPLSLCLYFEPAIAVFRAWTAQNFLRRIQWWLEKSAKGELHAADQPVENLFFASPHEIVLPWNAASVIGNPNRRLVVTELTTYEDGRDTLKLDSIPLSQTPPTLHAACLEISLPPLVSGVVERAPLTLGELHTLLAGRGIDLGDLLRTKLFDQVEASGTPASQDARFTLFLIYVPIVRHEGGVVEKININAFMVLSGPLALGKKCGALHEFQGKFFRDHKIGVASKDFTSDDWKDVEVQSVEVLRENNAQAARAQSGIKDPGPKGVLIGAGSLGSAILSLWDRNGWGTWTVIDKDHVKPHNLARHVAQRHHIGRNKVDVVAELHEAAIGEGRVIPVHGDACDLSDQKIATPIREAEAVVDVSTTLEYPRLSSQWDNLPRHVSAFITPSGNYSVLLSEDKARSIRLRTLEAQYYRALIQYEWGKDHLDQNLGTYWSGASCRDISVVLPYSRIVSHASLLSEQIPFALAAEDAAIKLWCRDSKDGTITAQSIGAFTESTRQLYKVNAHYDAGLEAQLRELRNKHLPNETGGVLLGYYDFNIEAVVIVCGLPAPPDSISTPTSFERGTEGLADAVNEATRRTGNIVGYVGEWHTHPRGHSAHPSQDDIIQLFHLAYGMSEDGLPALQLIVGESDIEIIQGQMLA